MFSMRQASMFGYYLDLAMRSLKRNKVLTALMILCVGLGIGASMTMLTVLHVMSGPAAGTQRRPVLPASGSMGCTAWSFGRSACQRQPDPARCNEPAARPARAAAIGDVRRGGIVPQHRTRRPTAAG